MSSSIAVADLEPTSWDQLHRQRSQEDQSFLQSDEVALSSSDVVLEEEAAATIAASAIPHPTRLLGKIELLGINASIFAFGLISITVSFLVLPAEVERLFTDSQSATLGILSGLGSLTHLVAPLVGMLSDRNTSRFGRRRPYLVLGAAITVVAAVLMNIGSAAKNQGSFLLGYLVLLVGLYLSYGVASGLLPDLVPMAQIGEGSGYNALANAVGSLLGFIFLIIFPLKTVYFLYIAASIGFLLWNLKAAKETPLHVSKQQPIDLRTVLNSFCFNPIKHRNFGIVWFSRLLYFMGVSTQTFLLYYLRDIVGITAPEDAAQAFAILAVVVLCSSMVVTVPAGKLSDRIGRLKLVYASCAMISIAFIIFIMNSSFALAVGLGSLYGFGQGIYMSVDWALGVQSLPNKEESGRYLGLWSISSLIGSLLSPLIGGLVLESVGKTDSPNRYSLVGYSAVFILGAVYTIAGGLLLRRLKGIK